MSENHTFTFIDKGEYMSTRRAASFISEISIKFYNDPKMTINNRNVRYHCENGDIPHVIIEGAFIIIKKRDAIAFAKNRPRVGHPPKKAKKGKDK